MKPSESFATYCRAFIARDAATIADLFTEDGEFYVPLADGRIKGKKNIEAEMHRSAMGQRDVEVDIRRAIDQGSIGYVEATYRGIVVGTGGKLDGSPHRLDFRFLARITMRDGKIERLEEFLDTRPLFPEERQKMFTINRLTPYFQKTVEEGCLEWMVYNNMHFPIVYDHLPYQAYHALLHGVTLWDVGLERQTQIKGPDAKRFVDYLCCRDMSTMKTGDCRYTILTDEQGLVMSDPVTLFVDNDTIWLSHGNVDLTLWARGLAVNSPWRVEVSEPDVAPVQVQGPLSVPLMDEICSDKPSTLKNYKCMKTSIDGMAVVVSRTGWSSGEGFEIYPLSGEYCVPIWEKLKQHGEKYGLMVTAPNLHRAVERGVTDINYYNNSGMNALEDLGAKFVNLDGKEDFIGRDALRKIRDRGVARHSVGLIFDAEVPRLEWFWDLTDDDGKPGRVRWAVHSFALDKSIGIAVVDKAVKIGDAVTVIHPGGTVRARVTDVPFVGKT
jgi:glycine cleavage system aminomethyltransferase T/ketosteroid isomerase-like protein